MTKQQEDALRMQVQVLADRLAMILALCDDEAIDCFLEGEDGRFWEQLKIILLHDDVASRTKQEELRGSQFYEPAKTEVREFLRKILVSLYKTAA